MSFENYFPIWNKLTSDEQNILLKSIKQHEVKKGTIIHNGSDDCIGLVVIRQGQLRSYILSEEGREITLYRLFDHDICLFSASCMMQSLQFNITIEAEKDSIIWTIPPDIYKSLMENSTAIANYTNELMASHLSEVMWLIEQILWKSFDKRLAAFLLEESNIEESDTLKITHEKIAAHLGTAREVVTRMLRYFQSEQIVSLSRGSIQINNPKKLQKLIG